jgi:hypothetical protein
MGELPGPLLADRAQWVGHTSNRRPGPALTEMHEECRLISRQDVCHTFLMTFGTGNDITNVLHLILQIQFPPCLPAPHESMFVGLLKSIQLNYCQVLH